MNILAIIPARGGSKGIPGKNIRLVGGKPLLAWSIEQAQQTTEVSRVIVSTDSAEIAKVARRFGAEVISRPAEISGDTASSESCLVHALDSLKAKKYLEPDLVVFLQATSPLREPDDIQQAIATLAREQADSLFSACRVEGFVWRIEKDESLRSFSYDYLNRPRRQDAPEDLIENGSIYIFKPWVLRQFNNRLGGKVAVYHMPALNSFQIDEPADLDLIEALMAYRNRTAGPRDHGTIDQGDPLSVVSSQWAPIKLLALDFDGVLTDNRVLVREDGSESVWCSRSDGMGISRLKQIGVEVVVISKEKNPVVAARCRKLDIPCIQGCDNKLSELRRLASDPSYRQSISTFNFQFSALQPREIAYVGNDVNDLECLRWTGLPIAVADAVPEVLSAAKWRTTKPGGIGAVREVCDAILAARK